MSIASSSNQDINCVKNGSKTLISWKYSKDQKNQLPKHKTSPLLWLLKLISDPISYFKTTAEKQFSDVPQIFRILQLQRELVACKARLLDQVDCFYSNAPHSLGDSICASQLYTPTLQYSMFTVYCTLYVHTLYKILHWIHALLMVYM